MGNRGKNPNISDSREVAPGEGAPDFRLAIEEIGQELGMSAVALEKNAPGPASTVKEQIDHAVKTGELEGGTKVLDLLTQRLEGSSPIDKSS